jgi:short-subunit dehydrogenase
MVTGASSGIGEAFAEALAKDRYDLVVIARRGERLAEVAKRLTDRYDTDVEVFPADLTEDAGLHSVESRLASDRELTLLVNSAGFGTIGPFIDLDPDRLEQEIRLNVVALTRLTRAALPAMIRRGEGAIVNVSSLAGLYPGPYGATYGATKAYVNSLSEALQEEVRGTGVQIQLLCPGFTRTEFQEVAGAETSRIPGFAWMSAEEVVKESLDGLRSRTSVVVPGRMNRGAALATGLVPRSWISRMMGTTLRHTLASSDEETER